MGILSYEILTILLILVIVFTFECQAWITMADNKQTYIIQKLSLSVLFLDLKFCKNLGFSLSEHCKWDTCPFVNLIQKTFTKLILAFPIKKIQAPYKDKLQTNCDQFKLQTSTERKYLQVNLT